MKGVFLGSDFMYRQDGKLVPIEINTNIGLDAFKRVETYEEAYSAAGLASFVKEHNISKIVLEGALASEMTEMINRWTGPEFEGIEILGAGLEAFDNSVEDNDATLKIRTSYSDDAIVDAYCRDKIEFLKLNQAEYFGQKYTYKNSEGDIEGTEVDILDNGNNPNFIVKCRYPQYSSSFPKLLRFTSEKQVRAWAEENLEENYYITPFLYNENNLLEFPNGHKRMILYRHIAVLVATAEGLVSVPVGAYTKWTNAALLENPSLDMYENGVLKDEFRQYYLTKNTVTDNIGGSRDILAEKDDEILMSDGTWKKVQDIKEGDKVRSLKVEGKDGADIHEHTVDYNESLEDFEAETEFEEAEISYLKGPLEGYVDRVQLTFEDGLIWTDTARSSYLILDPEDGTVRFQTLDNLKAGDTILLLNASRLDNPVYVQKTVAAVSTEREFVEGYNLVLDGSHIFLSREPGQSEMFASIEHNEGFCYRSGDMYSIPSGFSGSDTVGSLCTNRTPWLDNDGVSHDWYFGCAFGNNETVKIPMYTSLESAFNQYRSISVRCEPWSPAKDQMCSCPS